MDPSEKWWVKTEVPLLDEMKDSWRTSKSDNEALDADDYIEAEL